MASFAKRTETSIGARIAPFDAIVGADHSSNDDSAVKPRTVQQCLEDFFGQQIFEIKARHVEPPAVQDTVTDTKVLPHEMVERHPPRRHISPMLVGRKLDVAVARKRFQYLHFYQRRLTIDVVLLRIAPEPGRITVAFQPDAGDQARLRKRDHRRRRFRRNMDV